MCFISRIRCLSLLLVSAASMPVAGQSSAANLQEVIVVFKTHFDIGYTDLAANVLQNYRTNMIDKALAVCEANRDLPADQQFVWTLPGWPLDQILWPGQEADRRRRIEAAILEGRFVWHAWPVTTHTESLELEDLVRGMVFSAELARAYDHPLPRDAKMTDVPSHCWALPTILANAGVEFLHLGGNRGSTPPDAPTLFWWEGPDGSRVLTMLVLGYGTGLTPPENWPHHTWLALMHTGDNHGPPAPEEVKKVLDEAGRTLPGVKVRMGRLSDFADAIRRENPELPVVRADMPDTWIHGIMSHPADTALARRVRPRIGHLEALNTLLGMWGLDPGDIKSTIARAYERSLMYGEHTWGMDAKRFPRLYGKDWEESYAKGTYAKAEESWAEHGNYIHQAAGLVEPTLRDHLLRLARGVSADGPRVVVFNPLPWARSDVVSLSLSQTGGVKVVEADSSREVPAEATGETIRFMARDLPPMGYRTYQLKTAADRASHVRAARPDASTHALENEFVRVHLDAMRGGVTSLVDKRSGRELVGEGEVLGRYLYQRFDANDATRYTSSYTVGGYGWIEGDFGKPGLPPASEVARTEEFASGFDLRVETGPVSSRAVLSSKPSAAVPHDVKLAVTIYRDLPFVDLEWFIADKPPTPWPEAGWLCLPLAANEPEYRLGRLGAVVDPLKDIQPASNFDVFCLTSGMTISDADGYTLGICPLDSPLVSIGKPGLWQFTRRFEPQSPTVYINLFNNQWSTNFSQWVDGTWSSRVRLFTGETGGLQQILGVAAAEARSPAMIGLADGPAGRLPRSATGLSLSRPGVAVTAFGGDPYGHGTLLRLWEQTGTSGSCTVTLPSGRFVRAQPCDLRSRPRGQALPISDGEFVIDLKAFAPASFLLE